MVQSLVQDLRVSFNGNVTNYVSEDTDSLLFVLGIIYFNLQPS